MKNTGLLLKNRRDALKISVAEVSIATKITPRMIQAIETADMEHLPAKTFLRGFIKSYATFLKMDVESVLKSFVDEMRALELPPVTESPASSPVTPTASRKSETPSTQNEKASHDLISPRPSVVKRLGWAAGIGTLVILIVVVQKIVEKYEREGQVDEPPTIAEPIRTEAGEPAKPTETKAVEEDGPVAKAQTIKPPEAKPVEVVEMPPPTATKPAAKPEASSAAPVIVATPPKPAEAKPAETKPVEAPASKTQEVIIEALDKVDVVFSVNGGDETKVTLSPDQVHTIKAPGSVVIDISDGGAVNIIQNGRDIGVPGDLGRPKKLKLP